MDESNDLNKFQSCENGVPVRNLTKVISKLINLKLIRGEAWDVDDSKWVLTYWSSKGRFFGRHNEYWGFQNLGDDLSEDLPSIVPEPKSKFKPLPTLTEGNKPVNVKQKEQSGQLSLFSK
jgi:hypothetical protein